MKDGKAVVSGHRSLGCGHCAAVCPTGAVTVGSIDPAVQQYASFKFDNRWLPPGSFEIGRLVQLMGSRRSCRNFAEIPVARDILEDLIKVGVLAPSGTNSQKWTFTLLPHRNMVVALGRRIADYFRYLNRMAEKAWLRHLMKLIAKPQLDDYFRQHYQTVKDALKLYDTQGIDLLFHGAPALIIVGSAPGASCPAEDALLATQNILLAAHALGIGTCLIGFAVAAMANQPEIKQRLGIPKDETIHAAIALGYPEETYQRCAGRRFPCIRYVENPEDLQDW
jgi:nitroreductase